PCEDAAVCRGHDARGREDHCVRLPRSRLPCPGCNGGRPSRSSGVMKLPVDIWLRGTDFATTVTIDGPARPPDAWTDDDVRFVLERMLRTMDQQKRPGEGERTISLRGLSWIVNPYEDGGVVIAIEITLGAAVSGPFEIEKARLEGMIARVLAVSAAPAPPGV